MDEARPQPVGEEWETVQRALIGDSNALTTLFAPDRVRLYRTAFSLLNNKEDAEGACAACDGERRLMPLRAVLPQLVRRYKVSLEVVADKVGGMLRQAGGIGAWLKSFRPLQGTDSQGRTE